MRWLLAITVLVGCGGDHSRELRDAYLIECEILERMEQSLARWEADLYGRRLSEAGGKNAQVYMESLKAEIDEQRARVIEAEIALFGIK